MAEETQNLVQQMPAEDVVIVSNNEPSTITCNRRNVLPALSIFVALLIAGQAVSIYFLTQQSGKITELDATTKQLKLNEMIKKLPGSPPSQNKPQMRMANFNIPLALSDDDGTQQKLESKAMSSNSVEDAAQYILQMGNPLRKYPSFNGTILDNLRKLRRSLSYQEWMLFDSWLQQWYLFYLVQNTNGPQATPAPNDYDDDTVTGAPVMTQCQMRTQAHVLPGAYVPQCDENGDFKPMQCWRSTGYCWCVYRNGTEVAETRSRAKVDCSVINEPINALNVEMVDF